MKTKTKIIVGSIVAVVGFVAIYNLILIRNESHGPMGPMYSRETAQSALDRSPRRRKASKEDEDRLSAIDHILEKLELGNIAFNAPRSMNLYNTATIQLLLGLATPTDELKRMVEAEGEKVAAVIQVSDRMEARLSGPNFTITAITPEIQAVSRNNITEWKWEVKPNSKGHQDLHLTLSVLLSVDGESTPRAIRTFDKLIDVEVTWHDIAVSFFKNNWQWLWTVILVPIIGWLWKRKKEAKSSAS